MIETKLWCWDPLGWPQTTTKVVVVWWCTADTEQTIALQSSLEGCGAHKENCKNERKLGNQIQASREQITTSFTSWKQSQNSIIFLEFLQKSELVHFDFLTL